MRQRVAEETSRKEADYTSVLFGGTLAWRVCVLVEEVLNVTVGGEVVIMRISLPPSLPSFHGDEPLPHHSDSSSSLRPPRSRHAHISNTAVRVSTTGDTWLLAQQPAT